MISLDNETGFLIPEIKETAPAFNVFPSIIEASISWVSSAVKTAPFPALNKCESSKTTTAFSTASIAVPPFSKTTYPAFMADFKTSLYCASNSEVIIPFTKVPAPP